MKIRSCLAIVNPQGGMRSGGGIVEDARRLLADASVRLDIHVTQWAGHASQLAEEIDLEGYDCLCIVGGDGTVHEVIGGLMRRDEGAEVIPLGLIPAGTGNTLHLDLGCTDTESAIEAILHGGTRSVDVVKVNAADTVHYCVNIVGWGGISDINLKAERLRKLGRSRYVLAALWQMARPINRFAKVCLDDEVLEGDFQFVIACVTKSTGTGMVLAPQAIIDDGKIDVVILRKVSRYQLLQTLRRVFDGSHIELPFVEYRQVRSFSIEAEPSELNLDGEVKATTPFAAETVPIALPFRYRYQNNPSSFP